MSNTRDLFHPNSTLIWRDATAATGFGPVPTAEMVASYEQKAQPSQWCDKCLLIVGGAVVLYLLSQQ